MMPSAGRIGPNAVTRLAEVLPGLVGAEGTRLLFAQVGLAHYLATPPEQMVDEAEVARLHQQLFGSFGAELAHEAARRAGTLTGRYLLARRIPRPVQWLLRWLPPLLSARVLVSAIERHAWTFCGSGRFEARFAAASAGRSAPPLQLVVRNNPLCRGLQREEPACDFFAACFECLFQELVHPGTQVRETRCEARGDTECRFELRWPPADGP
jgi:divinyl protochlorophyllide a 8-vinyl-reductase